MNTEPVLTVVVDILQNPLVQVIGVTCLILALTAFSIQLWRYGPAIDRLDRLEVLSQLYHLGETQRDMTRAFGEATASAISSRQMMRELNKTLEALRDGISDIQTKLAENNAERITQAQLEAEQQQLPAGTFYRRTVPLGGSPREPGQLLDSIKKEWTGFLDEFRTRLDDENIPVQLNRIGKMTYMLTDVRNKRPLPIETADLIIALHCQYKRHVSLQRVSALEHDNFVQLLKTAVDELKRSVPRGEVRSARAGTSAAEHDSTKH